MASAVRTSEPIFIDAILDEESWKQAEVAKDFYRFEPFTCDLSEYLTEVRFLYNDYALIIGAVMHDANPDKIMSQLSDRDNLGQTDFFGITIDPFNDQKTAYTFILTPTNIQYDARQTDNEDSSWDAVWRSAAIRTQNGWQVEIEIPYSALRFPKMTDQTWGLNMVRNIQGMRYKEFWNCLDPKIESYLKQLGTLSGIKDITPPVRLSVMPYASAYVNKNAGESDLNYSYKYGLDLKYGLTDSYTLDMMLIPDFGQVPSDDKVLNITPFETFYEEKRAFFTEGTELFDKGKIFYSRRIGGTPRGKDEYSLDTAIREHYTDNPSETRLINVTKITGKSRNGLALGFLNGLTQRTQATIEDSAGNSKKVLTQALTNYNVMVFDQSLKNNSYISLANTNYFQPETDYMSNVSAVDFYLEEPTGVYALKGIVGGSVTTGNPDKDKFGGKYELGVAKVKGNFRFEVEQELNGKSFNVNDLGYTDRFDEIESNVNLAYNFYEPRGKFVWLRNNLNIANQVFASKGEYVGTDITLSSTGTLKSYLTVNMFVDFTVGNTKDFYEARKENRYFMRPGYFTYAGWFSPDYRKRFLADINYGISKYYHENMMRYWVGVSPLLRFNDHLFVRWDVSCSYDQNIFGFNRNIKFEDNEKTMYEDSIPFSQRDILTAINALTIKMVFNSSSSFSLKARHYWRTINDKEHFFLEKDGTLSSWPMANQRFTETNVNQNFFNIDAVYTWRFAPGSEFSLVWKMASDNYKNEIDNNYFGNLGNVLGLENNNSISVRFLYYLDYQNVKRWFNQL